MLRFILGAGGTGKSAYIHSKILELARNGRQALLLVPDQSSFETEKVLLDLLGARLSGSVTVFGFDGMCRHVFQRTRSVPLNVIDNGTRAVLMSVALEQLTEKLTLLRSKRRRGVSDMLLMTLSECKKSGISTDMLRNAADKVDDETLKIKLTETALVLDAFYALLSRSYVDPLDNLERLKTILDENQEIFRNQVLYIDSFSGFSKTQLEIIRVLLSRCSEVNVALTLDPSGSRADEVFEISRSTYSALKDIAKRDFVEIKAPVKLDEPLRFENGELAALEQGVFRRNFAPSFDESADISVYSAADVCDECVYIARQIKRLVMETGCRYRDISVICRDAKNYQGVIDMTFEKYDIPFFIDSHQDVCVKPPVRLVNAIFRLITGGFEREDALALLKSGLTRHSGDEVSAFENYVYIWNLSGKRLCSPFTLNPRGYSETFTEDDEKVLDVVEGVRKSIIDPLVEFRENCKGKNAREITGLLYRLLETLDAPRALSRMYDELESGVEKGLGAEQIRVWALLMEVLDKMVASVGEMNLTAERYFELLTIQISNIEFSQIPQTLDCVTVTTAQRVRNASQKVSFVIGCCEGEFPAVPRSSGLFSSYEIKQLLLNDIPISDDFSYLANLETYMAYCALTAPSRRLFISYPCMSMDGERKKPSAIISEVLKLFPNLKVTDRLDYDGRKESMLALAPAFEEYARSLSGGAELSGLGEFFAQDPRWLAGTETVKRSLDKTPFQIRNPENARLLFGENLTVSASQVEKFSKCRFSYFCSYGLRVRERLKAEINPMEYGTLVHHILEQFFKKYSKKEYSLMTDPMLLDFIKDSVSEYLEGYLGGSQTKDKSFLYRLEVLCSNVLLLLRHLVDELCQSDFDVADCELKIGGDIPAYTVKLPTGENIAVCGSVDRVDIMHTENGDYLRIIDYKTGSKTFSLSDILYGLNLQMLLYLCSIESKGEERYGKIIPAGILYMPAVVPNISADGLDDEQIKKKISDSFKMNGLLLDDVRVIKGMDKTEGAKYIPVKIKNGSSVKSDSLATLAGFGRIFKKLNDTVARMGEKLFSGDIAAAPLKGGTDACEYCPYDSVCGYRQSSCVNVYKLDNEEVFKRLDEENKVENEKEGEH